MIESVCLYIGVPKMIESRIRMSQVYLDPYIWKGSNVGFESRYVST